jgi:hypothetical protein
VLHLPLVSVSLDSDDDCKQCETVLAELEHIDDEAGEAGVDFVMIDDRQMARDLGVFALPAVVFFRNGVREPVIYAGDLKNEERILEWILLQKDPSSDMIEEYENEELLDFIRKTEYVAVYFCKIAHTSVLLAFTRTLFLALLFFISYSQLFFDANSVTSFRQQKGLRKLHGGPQ